MAMSPADGARYLLPASDRFGLNLHARVSITVDSASCGRGKVTQVKGAVLVAVQCGKTTATVATRVGSASSLLTEADDDTMATSFEVSSTEKDGASTVVLQAFLEGGFVDIVRADRELAQSFAVASNNTGVLPIPAGNQPADWVPTGTGVAVGVTGGTAQFDAVLFNMNRGVEACPSKDLNTDDDATAPPPRGWNTVDGPMRVGQGWSTRLRDVR